MAVPSLNVTVTVPPTLRQSTDVMAVPSLPVTMPYPRARMFLGFRLSNLPDKEPRSDEADSAHLTTRFSNFANWDSTLPLIISMRSNAAAGESLASMTSNLLRMSATFPVSAESARDDRSSRVMPIMSRSDMAR